MNFQKFVKIEISDILKLRNFEIWEVSKIQSFRYFEISELKKFRNVEIYEIPKYTIRSMVLIKFPQTWVVRTTVHIIKSRWNIPKFQSSKNSSISKFQEFLNFEIWKIPKFTISSMALIKFAHTCIVRNTVLIIQSRSSKSIRFFTSKKK